MDRSKPHVIPEVYSTKYWATVGIQKFKNGQYDPKYQRMVAVPEAGALNGITYLHCEDWHCTLEGARLRVGELRQAKLSSLQKKINAMKTLDPTKMEPVNVPWVPL